jgi:hypothetical protein
VQKLQTAGISHRSIFIAHAPAHANRTKATVGAGHQAILQHMLQHTQTKHMLQHICRQPVLKAHATALANKAMATAHARRQYKTDKLINNHLIIHARAKYVWYIWEHVFLAFSMNVSSHVEVF